ncbi:MAG: hypothetical protein AAFV33_11105 [Chloroflexota bacterium]
MIRIILVFFFGFGFQQQQPIPTATPVPEVEDVGNRAEQIVATIDAFRNDPPLYTDGEQIYNRDGQPLLPALDTPELTQAFGYAKWVLDINNTRAIFGPFAPIVNHVRIFFTLVLAWFVFYVSWRARRLLWRFVRFLWRYQWVLWLISTITIVVAIIYAIYEVVQFVSSGQFTERFNWIPLAIEWITIKIEANT